MPVLTVRRGSGITARRERVFGGTRQDIRDTLFEAAETRTFEGSIRPIETNARATLRNFGIDPDNRGALRADDDSPEDFCDRILTWIEIAREALARNNAAGAVRAGLEIGRLVCQYEMKCEWEKPALAGNKSLQGAGDGGRRRARALKPKNLERDKEMAVEFQKAQRAGSRISATALKERIGGKYRLGRSAAVKAIDRGLKILSGYRGTVDR